MPDLRAFTDIGRFINDRRRVALIAAHERDPATDSAVWSETGAPRCSSERWAASRTPSTRKPLLPSVSGDRRVLTDSRKAAHSRRNGSVVSKGTTSPAPRIGTG